VSVEGAHIPGRDAKGPMTLDADVVIVGSGAGGAVVAAHLAEAGQSVVVLEEGPHVHPEDYGRMRPSESMRHVWRDGGTTFAVGLGDTPMINVTMGRCVGGSSVLTGGVCFRTPGHVLDGWVKERGLGEMSEAGLEPAFEDVERAVHVEEVPVQLRSRSTIKFGEGAAKLGHPLLPMKRNTKGCNGCGHCNFGCPHGAKLSVDVTYLVRAVAAGARIVSDARVDRVTVDGSRATGVVGKLLDGARRRPLHKLQVRAKRVVLAAGSYGSPTLLMRTGVGRGQETVGRNLTLHPAFRMMAAFDEPIEGWKGALQSAYSDAYEDERITLTGLFIPPGVLAGTMPGVGPAHAWHAQQIPYLGVFGGLIHDEGGGRIHHILGRTFSTYRMSGEDRAAVPRILRIMAETFFAGGAREVYMPVLGLGAVSPDRLRTLDLEHLRGRDIECASQHPLGSCRMGTSAAHAVVDEDGQTFEVRELFVVDGSVLPSSLGVNPQLSIMAVATHLAWKLRERPWS